ncbi:c-type cytochrome [Lysinibacillus sp. KU-BSD001]|uniref:c-type cytochrome n=1 Tax=Lysinibacillus sp. KU-BSD001 TaxID=3141328 RepID=UPI0036E04E04
MNFPSVDFPWFGNGTVIAAIAIIHVMISHGIAIGMTVLTVSAEYRAMKKKNNELNELAKKMAKWILIITTTMGAMTGVGIWFSTTVLQPDSIGSLLRIFFWAWVVEWIVFITEVVLLIIYYYTWDKCQTIAQRKKHINLGIALALFSWLTMAIITGVLAAKLTPGNWIETKSFWDAFMNPTYLPSLGFRMFLAVMLAITITSFFVRWRLKNKELQSEMLNVFAFWGAISLPGTIITGLWYLKSIPAETYDMIVWSTGMSDTMFQVINGVGLLLLIVFLFWITVKPKTLPWVLSLVVFATSLSFIGEFEMVRESIRKPYIIYDYMYANGLLAEKQDEINEEGYLVNAAWATYDTVDQYTTKAEAGRDIFIGQCLICHTENGWRSSRAMANRVDGWSEESIKTFIPTMHNVRKAMPPFMGTEEELEALAAYLAKITEQENEVAANE